MKNCGFTGRKGEGQQTGEQRHIALGLAVGLACHSLETGCGIL